METIQAPILLLNKGEPAPWRGYLLTRDSLEQLVNHSEQNDLKEEAMKIDPGLASPPPAEIHQDDELFLIGVVAVLIVVTVVLYVQEQNRNKDQAQPGQEQALLRF